MLDSLDLDRWNHLSSAQREVLARKLVRDLPDGFAFESIREYRLGSRCNEIALYRYGDASFALVPGDTVEIGFAAAGWTPTDDEVESWRDTAEEYGIGISIEEHVTNVTLRPRAVHVPALLAETVATEPGWRALEPSDPRIRKAARSLERTATVQIYEGDSRVQVRRCDDGSVVAHEALRPTHADLVKQLQSSCGVRLPTSDEWEHLCGGGARTLFRWGDHAPCDRYPTDTTPAEVNWHRQPNAFGLQIAVNPYKHELTSDPEITRGGDGGGMICGGAGFFIGWLTLATAYFEPELLRRDPLAAIDAGYTIARRVLPLT